MFKLKILICILSLNGSVLLYATDTPRYRDSLYSHINEEGAVTISCRFSYQQGKSEIRADLADNAIILAQLDSFMTYAVQHTNLRIKHVRITGFSSIEGSNAINERLARERTATFYMYLCITYPGFGQLNHDTAWISEDWHGLSALIRNSQLNEKFEVLEIIRSVRSYEERKTLLRKLNGGKPYIIIEQTMLPLLRRVELEVMYEHVKTASNNSKPLNGKGEGKTYNREDHLINMPIADQTSPVYSDENDSQHPGRAQQEGVQESQLLEGLRRQLPAVFALKTNLLAWSGIMPDLKQTTQVANMALEVYLSPNWSIQADASYAYWRYDDNRQFQGLSGYGIEPRYRMSFNKGVFEPYAGIYGRVGDYDLRRPDGNQCGEYWDAGLSAGLSVKLPWRWRLELGVRYGYVNTETTKYTLEAGKCYFDSKAANNSTRITGLGMSIVYVIK